jgi:Mrp family chromosome partitioning ATPase/capsular polysaccharide biosynthesis protein
MTLQDMLRTVWFGRWLVLISLVAAGAGAWLYASQQEPQYAAQATVQIIDAETLAGAGVRLESDPSLVTSDAVTQAAAQALGDPSLANALAGSSTGEYVADSPSTIAITTTGTDPEAAVDAANALADAYDAALQQQFDDDLAGMQSRLDALATTIDQQQQAITASRVAQAAANPNGTVDTVDGLLEAQYSASTEQYQTLAGQLAQAQVLATPAAILQNAVSAELVSVPPMLVYAVAVLAGLLVGIALAVLRRGLDTKVRTAGSARRSAGAPVLARLSGTAVALRTFEGEGELPVARREATAYTRSVRELRTALQAAVENDSGSAVIVVTAADLETPRSFVAANLAASWALSGRSVVVLSGDLRQPRLNSLLPAASQAPGRGSRTTGRSRTAAVPTAIPHLSVHPALRTELDPADYLASDEVRGLIDQLRRTADVVIIDAPPMLVAADATILGAYADGVLLAVTLGHTPMGAVEESAERLRAANARLLGLSLDGAVERRQVAYEATYAFAGAEQAGAAEEGVTAEAEGAAADAAADAEPAAAEASAGGDAPAEDPAAGSVASAGETTDADHEPEVAAASAEEAPEDRPADAEAVTTEVPVPGPRAGDAPSEPETTSGPARTTVPADLR